MLRPLSQAQRKLTSPKHCPLWNACIVTPMTNSVKFAISNQYHTGSGSLACLYTCPTSLQQHPALGFHGNPLFHQVIYNCIVWDESNGRSIKGWITTDMIKTCQCRLTLTTVAIKDMNCTTSSHPLPHPTLSQNPTKSPKCNTLTQCSVYMQWKKPAL